MNDDFAHDEEEDDEDEDEDDDEDPISLKSLSPDGQPGEGRPWYLLGLAGNLSVVHARQADFLKYLRQGGGQREHPNRIPYYR